MCPSILRRDEIVLLRTKHLPNLHRAYKALVDDLNLIAEKTGIDEDGDIWLSEKQQRRIIRKIYRDYVRLNNARSALRVYLRRILARLEEPVP